MKLNKPRGLCMVVNSASGSRAQTHWSKSDVATKKSLYIQRWTAASGLVLHYSSNLKYHHYYHQQQHFFFPENLFFLLWL